MRRMLSPSRFRRIAKWTGLGVCAVLLGMWGVSLRLNVAYKGWLWDFEFGGASYTLSILSGMFAAALAIAPIRTGLFNTSKLMLA